MSEESFFGKLANDVFQATEEIAARFEEGLSALMTGDLPDSEIHQHGSEPMDLQSEEDLNNLSEEQLQKLIHQELMENSPLEGIADSVLGDIMKNKVRGTGHPA